MIPKRQRGLLRYLLSEAMDKKVNEQKTEVYVTEVLGIPLVRKYVEVCGGTAKTSDSYSHLRLALERVKIIMIILMLLSVSMALCILYYPPQILHELADSLLESYSRKGDMEKLQSRLSLCEANKRILLENLGNCSVENSKLAATLIKEEENFEGSIGKLKSELLAAENNIRIMKEDIINFERSEKAHCTRESIINQNLTLLNERKIAVEQKLLTAEETIDTLEENTRELKNSLQEHQTRTLELSNSVTVSEKERTDMEVKLFETERRIIKIEKETEKAEKNVKECQRDVYILKNNIKSITMENLAISKKFKDVELNFSSCTNKSMEQEKYHSKFLVKVEELEESVKVLKKSLNNMTLEKQGISKKFEDTKFRLGECRNKNMDHEISNSELLMELEQVKKELASC